MVDVVVSLEDRINRARIVSWIFMGLTAVSLFFNVLLVLTMFQMGSRLTVMTQLFNWSGDTQELVLSDIFNKNLGDLSTLKNAVVRRFIEERNFQIPDEKEMLRRWGPAGTLAFLYAQWTPVVSKDDDKIKDVLEALPTHADNIQIMSSHNNVVNVNFDLWTHAKKGSFKTKKQATIHLAFLPGRVQQVATPGFYYNPLGLTVVHYSVGDVKNK